MPVSAVWLDFDVASSVSRYWGCFKPALGCCCVFKRDWNGGRCRLLSVKYDLCVHRLAFVGWLVVVMYSILRAFAGWDVLGFNKAQRVNVSR